MICKADDKCPEEIVEEKPDISIIDIDAFPNDTLTGGGTSHRTNWTMVQKEVNLYILLYNQSHSLSPIV